MPASPRRRAFGQHFLRDQTVIDKITEAALGFVDQFHAKALLEIGPGKGALTDPLLKEAFFRKTLESFLIVEKDRKLASEWTSKANPDSRIHVVDSDFLDVQDEFLFQKKPLVVVSNLPYSAGTAILQKLARHPDRIPAMVLMFQQEVAERLRAKENSKAWGSLSIWIQNQWEVEKFIPVSRHAFFPPPDVFSEVVILKARAQPLLSYSEDRKVDFEKLIKIAFAHRRKMLRSGLPKDSRWLKSLERSGIETTLRAEALTWTQWQKWLDALATLEEKA